MTQIKYLKPTIIMFVVTIQYVQTATRNRYESHFGILLFDDHSKI